MLRSVAPRGLDDASRQRLRTAATGSGNHTLLPTLVVALHLVASRTHLVASESGISSYVGFFGAEFKAQACSPLARTTRRSN